MNRINRKIDEFCYRHPNFGIPNLMKVIVFGTAIVYLLYFLVEMQNPGGGISAISFLAFNLDSILHGEIWRLITFIFVPINYNPFFLLISLFFYYFIGSTLEREWGTVKFNIFYFGGVFLTLLTMIIASLATGSAFTFGGVDYVNMSLFLAFAMLYPETTVLLLIIPVKIKWLAWFDAALFAFTILTAILQLNFIGALLPLIALLNFFIFFGSDLLAWVQQKTGQVHHNTSRKTIEYKKAVKEQKKEKGYHHKCCICGKTDTDYPNLDFRYCSKCAGYHCYCSEHINNHIHITEE